MSEQVKKTLGIWIYVALTVVALLVFGQVRNFDFVNYDDNKYVYENLYVLNGLTPSGLIWAFTTGFASNWHPLTWLSLMLDCQLFGTNPGWMHLVNLLLHIANTLLLFAVLKKMTGSLWPSAFVAAAFAIHPMHVESVAWITERKDVLSTLFLLLTLAAYVGYVRRRGLARYLLTVLLFALGLMAKPMLVTLPFVLLLLDYWPLNRFVAGWQILYRLIIEKIPLFVIAGVSSVITFLVQRGGGAIIDIKTIPLNDRVANALLSYTTYLVKTFRPQNLAVFYPLDTGTVQLWQVVLCALMIIVVSVLVIYFGRKRRYLPVGWFWFVGTLVPVIGIVQVGGQAFADRYTYIPYIGLFIMIAWGLPELFSKWQYRKFALGISAMISLAALGICARIQVSYWSNSIALFSHAIEVTQNNDVAYYGIGVTYGRLGRHQDAIESYKQAIRIKPSYAQAHNNLGVAYGNLGRYQDAIESYKKAIKIKPDYADAHCNLGISYGNLGRYQDAIESFKQAIRIKPDYAAAHYNLGAAYGNLGRYQDAIEPFNQAIRIKPDYADAHCNLGVAYLATGDKGLAMEEYKILKTMDAKQADKLLTLIHK